MKKRLSPAELKPLLKALSSTAGVIIGGQAVNLWAEHYQEHTPLWAGLGPFTSFDLNVLGSRNDALECGKLLGGEIFFPRSGENTANSGKVVAELHGQQIEIDFLHSPNGLAPAEVFELSRVIHFQEIPLRLLHPLHCLESKTVNLITLPQDSGERQDLKHLRLSIAIMRRHLAMLTAESGAEPLLLRWAHRIRANSNHEIGMQVTLRHGIRFQDAIPIELWSQRNGPLADFASKDWPQWQQENAARISDLLEIENWLKSLNSSSVPKKTKDLNAGSSLAIRIQFCPALDASTRPHYCVRPVRGFQNRLPRKSPQGPSGMVVVDQW